MILPPQVKREWGPAYRREAKVKITRVRAAISMVLNLKVNRVRGGQEDTEESKGNYGRYQRMVLIIE